MLRVGTVLALVVLLLGACASAPADNAVEPDVALPTGSSVESGTSPEAMSTPTEGATTSAPTEGPVGPEIVELDGSTSNLGLPADAWMPDLSPDGRHVVFLTSSTSVGFCGGCAADRTRLAIVPVGAQSGVLVHFDGDVEATDDVDESPHIARPAWSPDGSRIAFEAVSAGNVDIYVADLSDPAVWSDLESNAGLVTVPTVRLTTEPGSDEFPRWAPDGETIYYQNVGSGPGDSETSSTSEIWSVPARGGTPTRLTHNSVADVQPDAGPDGTIAYLHDGDIWTMAPDGANQQRLEVVATAIGSNPRWSSDGERIALLHSGDDSTGSAPLDVVIVELATGRVTTLDAQVASADNPVSWMPGGDAILVAGR